MFRTPSTPPLPSQFLECDGRRGGGGGVEAEGSGAGVDSAGCNRYVLRLQDGTVASTAKFSLVHVRPTCMAIHGCQ